MPLSSFWRRKGRFPRYHSISPSRHRRCAWVGCRPPDAKNPSPRDEGLKTTLCDGYRKPISCPRNGGRPSGSSDDLAGRLQSGSNGDSGVSSFRLTYRFASTSGFLLPQRFSRVTMFRRHYCSPSASMLYGIEDMITGKKRDVNPECHKNLPSDPERLLSPPARGMVSWSCTAGTEPCESVWLVSLEDRYAKTSPFQGDRL